MILSKLFHQDPLTCSLWFPEAHAVAPLVIGIIILLTMIAGSAICINSSITEYFGGKEIVAKFERPDEFNRYLRKLKQQLKPLCPGAAWAEAPSSR